MSTVVGSLEFDVIEYKRYREVWESVPDTLVFRLCETLLSIQTCAIIILTHASFWSQSFIEQRFLIVRPRMKPGKE